MNQFLRQSVNASTIQKNKMTKFFPLLFLAYCLFSSCGETTPHAVVVNPETAATDSLIAINQNVFQFTCKVPKDLLASHAAEIKFNDATGQLEFFIGDGFGIVAEEGVPNLGFIKKDLQEDLMWKNTIVLSEASRLVYKRALPDGSANLMQFIQHVKAGGKDYTVRTRPTGSFNEQEVEVMRKVADSMK